MPNGTDRDHPHFPDRCEHAQRMAPSPIRSSAASDCDSVKCYDSHDRHILSRYDQQVESIIRGMARNPGSYRVSEVKPHRLEHLPSRGYFESRLYFFKASRSLS